MIYITDYIENVDLERAIIGGSLQAYTDKFCDKNSVTVLLVWHFTVNETALKDFPNIKAIVRYGVGFDNIDLEFCKKKNIKVFNNPDYGVDEVSDTALAMILSLSRCIFTYDQKAQSLVSKPNSLKPWQEHTNFSAMRLKDSSIGLVGVGRIGSSLALKIKNIVGEIGFYDPYVSVGYEKVLGATRYESLTEMLGQSDIVSIHAPLSDKTKGMIDDSFVQAMKYGSILINSARGDLLASHHCLYKGLKSGQIGSVGLDVLPQEPPLPDPDDAFISSWLNEDSELKGRICINPHTAYYSPQSYKEMRSKAANMAYRAMYDKQFSNRII